MHDHRRHRLSPFLALGLIVPACDSGGKQIGTLDEDTETSPSTTADDGSGDSSALECVPEQDVDIHFSVAPTLEQDWTMTCAANVEPAADGYLVSLTGCSDVQGQAVEDHSIALTGEWPAPELADGDQANTEVVFMLRSNQADGYGTALVVLRAKSQGRVLLVAFHGTELLLESKDLAPLSLALDGAGCAPNIPTCASLDVGIQYRIGFKIGFGAAEAIVADDTRLSGFGAELGTGIAYDVLVAFAQKHECEPGGDFHELKLGIVGATI